VEWLNSLTLAVANLCRSMPLGANSPEATILEQEVLDSGVVRGDRPRAPERLSHATWLSQFFCVSRILLLEKDNSIKPCDILLPCRWSASCAAELEATGSRHRACCAAQTAQQSTASKQHRAHISAGGGAPRTPGHLDRHPAAAVDCMLV
jgi:hypothetical protein